MTLNVLHVAERADEIARFFSGDAVNWPVHIGGKRAVAVRWVRGDASGEVAMLVNALKARTEAPYRSTKRAGAIPIVGENEREPAVATISFWRVTKPGYGEGFRYQLGFSGSVEVWPGWFPG